MRRLRYLLAVAALAVAWIPVSALATGSCVVMEDPAGDVAGPANVFGLAPGEESSDIDITRLGVGYDGAGLLVTIGLADLTDAGDDRWDVSWEAGTSHVSFNASRINGAWEFSRHVARQDGGSAAGGFISGEADTVADEIRMRVASGDAAYAPPGTTLRQVSASSSHSETVLWSLALSSDTTSTVHFRLRSECSVLTSAVPMCTVLTDAAGDVGTSPGTDHADEQVDLRSVSFGATGDALIVRLSVKSLDEAPGEGVQQQSWTTSWRVGEKSYGVTADRSTDTSPAFSFTNDGAWGTATGMFDVSARTITIVVDRAAFPDRVALAEIVASSGSSSSPVVWDQYDSAPDAGAPGRFTPGVACGVDVPVCPPVADPAGDAGPILYTSAGDIPRNEPSLDVRSLGGVSGDSDAVRVGVRVADASAALADGWDVAGWTMSWVRSGSQRYFAQAVRTSSGVRFTYGVDPSSDSSSGPVFGGRRTTGSITGNVISVDVPLSAIGNPSSLKGFGATTWMMRSGNSAAPYRGADSTSQGRYVVGTVCGP